MRCSNQFNCKGEYSLRMHEAFCKLWVGEDCNCEVSHQVQVLAMKNTMWFQCSECGVAPSGQGQGKIAGRWRNDLVNKLGVPT